MRNSFTLDGPTVLMKVPDPAGVFPVCLFDSEDLPQQRRYQEPGGPSGRGHQKPTTPYSLKRHQTEKSNGASLPIVREQIPARLLFRLRRSGDFSGLWNRTRKLNDGTDSSYEFALSIYAFHRGLSKAQVMALVTAWWTKHGINGPALRQIQLDPCHRERPAGASAGTA
jgi:hypothetical protein